MSTEISFPEWNAYATNLGADNPFAAYVPGQLWWPLSTSINEWDYDFHRLMLADRIRMTAYQKAIASALARRVTDGPSRVDAKKEPLRVLDVGCGTGILIRFVADVWETLPANAKEQWGGLRIYGVDRDPRIAMSAYELLGHSNNPHGAILWRPEATVKSASANCAVVLTCRSDMLPQKLRELSSILQAFDSLPLPIEQELAPVFDLIISETIGGLGDDEDIVRILEHAAVALAAPGCYIIPEKLESYVAPVIVASRRDAVGLRALWGSEWRSEVQSINSEVYDASRLLDPRNIIWDAIVPDDCCDSELQVGDWVFNADQIRFGKRKLATSYANAGTFHVGPLPSVPSGSDEGYEFIGFKGWFVATLFEKTILKTAGSNTSGGSRTSSDCWKHRFAPIDSPIGTQPGDTIDVIFSREESEGRLESYTYRWRGRVLRNGWIVDRFDQKYLMKGPSASPGQPAAPRPLGRRALDFLLAMLLALLFGLLVETAIENLGARYTIAKWAHLRWQQVPQTLLLFALGINLVRVAHSAFVLAEDRVFHDERIRSQRRNNLLNMVPHFLRKSVGSVFNYITDIPAQLWPTLIVALGILMLVGRESIFEEEQPQVVLWYSVICSSLLLLWDFLPWLRFRTYLRIRLQAIESSKIEDANVSDAVLLGSIAHRQLVIRDVLSGWFILDVSFIALGVVYFMFSRAFPIEIWEVVFACALLAGCAFDWLLRGWPFYSQSSEYETS
jgi:type I protein arginine methyltransferase